MLQRNEWVEAGLMNGAIGTVRGFVWPEGGDPTARLPDGSADLKKQALCVVVEFDDVNLGEEEARHEDGRPKLDAEGRAVMVPRTFFPGMDLGLDAHGKPRASKCVPIFRSAAR